MLKRVDVLSLLNLGLGSDVWMLERRVFSMQWVGCRPQEVGVRGCKWNGANDIFFI
jgi:hypothetical protein